MRRLCLDTRSAPEPDTIVAVTPTAGRQSLGKLTLALLVVVAATVAGCGGSGPTSGGPAHSVRLRADPTGALTFQPTAATTAAAGEIELVMSNPSPVAHGIAIEGGGVNRVGAVVGRGRASTLIVRLKPGRYTFYCPVPGHRQAGMSGTLTVR
jgi:plastocyanin